LSNLFEIRGHFKLLIHELKVWLIWTWKLMSTWILQNPNPSSWSSLIMWFIFASHWLSYSCITTLKRQGVDPCCLHSNGREYHIWRGDGGNS
jgi:hypothetical protein